MDRVGGNAGALKPVCELSCVEDVGDLGLGVDGQVLHFSCLVVEVVEMHTGPVARAAGVGNGGEEDDSRRSALFQQVEEQFGKEEVTEVADADGQLESVFRAFPLVCQVREAGVAHQTVEPVVLGQKLGGEIAHRLKIGKIHAHDLVAAGQAGKALGGLLTGVGSAARHDDMAALLDQLPCRLETDARVGTRDDEHFATQVLCQCLLIDPPDSSQTHFDLRCTTSDLAR